MDNGATTLANAVAVAAADKGATNLVALDVSEMNPYTDIQVIVSGSSERNVSAIADGVVDDLLEQDCRPIRREGIGSGHWELIDYGTVVVHVFHEAEREYYALERLWREAAPVSLDVSVNSAPSNLE